MSVNSTTATTTGHPGPSVGFGVGRAPLLVRSPRGAPHDSDSEGGTGAASAAPQPRPQVAWAEPLRAPLGHGGPQDVVEYLDLEAAVLDVDMDAAQAPQVEPEARGLPAPARGHSHPDSELAAKDHASHGAEDEVENMFRELL
jgi:hypothetical protein